MPKQEFWIKVLLGILYVSSLVSIGLWMAGYMHPERVTYTRFGEVQAKKEIKEYIQQVEHIEIEHNNDNEVPDIKTSDDEDEAQGGEIETEVPRDFDIEYHLEDLEANINLNQYPPVKVLATGYTAGIESTGKEPGHPQYGITYSGVQVRRDLYSTIAADPDIFPIGTILYIPNYGYGVVADIGSAITGNRIDLYYNTVDDVYNLWGKQEVEVYVIQQGEGKVTEAMLDQLNQNEVLRVFKQR